MVYKNSTIELWTVAEWHSHWVQVVVQVLLVKEELPYQCRELRLIDMVCELRTIFRIVMFYKNDLDVDMKLSAVSNSPAVTASVTIFMTHGPVTAPWSSLPSSWITGNGGGQSPHHIIVVWARVVPCSIPFCVNTDHIAMSLSCHLLMMSICSRA